MNVLIGAVTGMGEAALTKEALSAAAEEMRKISIENSKLFTGVTDGTTTLTNLMEGKSEGLHGDNIGTGGTRVDLDALCGMDNRRCATNTDGSLKLVDGMVQWIATDENKNPISLATFFDSPEGQKMAGATGGIQGWEGTLFGIPYAAGSWQDKLIEAFGGTHDFIGGQVTGLYDEQGNIKQGMSGAERKAYDVWSAVAIAPAAPFAMAELLPPEVWKGIVILLENSR